MNRRDFLKATGATVVAGSLAGVLPDCDDAKPEPTLAGPSTLDRTFLLTDDEVIDVVQPRTVPVSVGFEVERATGKRVPGSPVTYRLVSVREPYMVPGPRDDLPEEDCPSWILDTARAFDALDWS